MKRILETTSDGSHTLFVPELEEHYHSVNGAIQESTHVFLEAGLRLCKKNSIRVFEVGFGTGLNAFLTFLDARKYSKSIHYTSIELYPISEELVQGLNYSQLLSPEDDTAFKTLHTSDWDKSVAIDPFFVLEKIKADFQDWDEVFPDLFDVVFFDAFAPDKQPEMWTQLVFDKIFKMMSGGGILVTYCAKGVVRRMLQSSGFEVERLPGPPGKREMLRALKPIFRVL